MNIAQPSIIKKLLNSFITMLCYLVMELVFMLQLTKKIMIYQPIFLITILLVLFTSGLILSLKKKIISDLIIFSFFSFLATISINFAKQLPGANFQLGYLRNTWLKAYLIAPVFITTLVVSYFGVITFLITMDILLLKNKYIIDHQVLFRYRKSIYTSTIYILFAMTSILIAGFIMPKSKVKNNYHLQGLIKNSYSINTYGASGYGFSSIINNEYDKLEELRELEPIIDNFNPLSSDPSEKLKPLYRVESNRNNAKGYNYFLLQIPGLLPIIFNHDEKITSLDKDEFKSITKTLYPTLSLMYSHASEYNNYFTSETSYYQESFLPLGARPSFGIINYNLRNFKSHDQYDSLIYSLPKKLTTARYPYKKFYISGFNEEEFNKSSYFKNLLTFNEVYGANNIFEINKKEKKPLKELANVYTDQSIITFLLDKLNSKYNFVQAQLNSYTLAYSNKINYSDIDIAKVDKLMLKDKYYQKYYLATLEIEKALSLLIDYLTEKKMLNKSIFYLIPAKSPFIKPSNENNIHSLYKIDFNQSYSLNSSQVSTYHIAPDIMREEDINPVNNLFYYPKGLPKNSVDNPIFCPETLTNSLFYNNQFYSNITNLDKNIIDNLASEPVVITYFKKQEIIDRYLLYPIALGF